MIIERKRIVYVTKASSAVGKATKIPVKKLEIQQFTSQYLISHFVRSISFLVKDPCGLFQQCGMRIVGIVSRTIDVHLREVGIAQR